MHFFALQLEYAVLIGAPDLAGKESRAKLFQAGYTSAGCQRLLSCLPPRAHFTTVALCAHAVRIAACSARCVSCLPLWTYLSKMTSPVIGNAD